MIYTDEIPVGRAEDLRGKVFGRWTVLYRVKDNRRGVWWKCKCDCGNIKTVLADRLKNGSSKSCGCLQKEKTSQRCIADLTGQVFDKLTVLYRSDKKYQTDGHVIWHCRCDCGNECDVAGNNLRNHTTLSCGCSRGKNISKKKLNDLTGQRFGLLTVLYRSGSSSDKSAIWHCKCDCGNELDVLSYLLVTKRKQHCGCLTQSAGATMIEALLKNNNILYDKEKSFSTCHFPKTNGILRFDFYINNHYIIEYDGEQHYIPNEAWGGEKYLQETQERDIFKNQWCKDNNIPLIRIPYTHLKKLCLEDLLLETTQFRVV